MFAVIGTFVHTPALGKIEILHDRLFCVSDEGVITAILQQDEPAAQQYLDAYPSSVTVLPAGCFLLPTFADLHLHAPQFMYLGTGLHLPLMQWLGEYAYHAEEMLDSNPELARSVYTKLTQRLVKFGTGTALLFGTIKSETNLILAEVFQAAGLRAFVGKLSMDISSRPTYVEPSAEAAIEAARAFIADCRGLVGHLQPHERLVEPAITPRFVPTCSDTLLTQLGALAKETGVVVQSHLAEAHDQVEWVRETRGKDDMDVFDEHGLITDRTVQAHCTFLTPTEMQRLSAAGGKIAHCPLSNAYFSAKQLPLRQALDQKIGVGLGSDCAGGYSLDVMNAMRMAVSTSRIRQGERVLGTVGDSSVGSAPISIDWKEALYLATRGGAAALGLSTGRFVVGAPFDAQAIHVHDQQGQGFGPLDFFEPPAKKMDEKMLEKWWCLGDSSNRTGVWVQGRRLL
ncbi:Metallo-dependent hydrolase [Auricularia subglabra TFB-10046 SS5]|nr:Metallo-dependent hydrolase [Auricularia subglabra TFB-10046 SS5]